MIKKYKNSPRIFNMLMSNSKLINPKFKKISAYNKKSKPTD